MICRIYTNFGVAFLLSLPQCEPMARTGQVKSHTIISYFYAYNILCFIRFTYLIGSGISQSKDEYIHIYRKGKEKQNSLRNKRSLLPETYIYVLYVCCYLCFFFVVVHDLDLDLHEKINRNKRTRMVIIFFSHLLFFFSVKVNF
jgi:hypothetical protein